MYRHLLVPLDDSELAVDIAAKALDLARALGARVTFFHARPDYGATADGALQRTLAPAEFAAAAEGHAQSVLAKAEVAARAVGVVHASVSVTSDRPFEAIIEAAEAHGCDLIFMASHGRRGVRALVLGSQTQKVLQHTPIPVLVSTVAGNVAGRERNQAVAIIKDEHRSLAAVIHGLREAVQQVREGRAAPDFALMRAAMHYIRNFPEALHHPKEEGWLFRRLRARTDEFNVTLRELEAQHRDGAARFNAVERALAAFENGEIGIEDFARPLENFAEIEWAHMSLEEKVVLPAAQAYLDDADWREIARAFDENADPRFGAEADQSFRQLSARILNLAAADRRQGGAAG